MRLPKRNRFTISLVVSSIMLVVATLVSVALVTSIIRSDYQSEADARIKDLATYVDSRIDHYQTINETIEATYEDTLFYAGMNMLEDDEPIDESYLNAMVDRSSITMAIHVDAQGTMLHTSDTDYYDAWSYDSSHPLYEFMQSNESIYIEPIRQSTINDEFYKYGNFKTDEDTVLQLGIEVGGAQSIESLLSLQAIIEDLSSMENVLYARFINMNYQVTSHSDVSLVGETLGTSPLTEAIDNETSFTGRTNECLEGIETYCIAEPIHIGDTFMGVLSVGYDVNYMMPTAVRINRVIVLVSMAVYLVIIAAFVYAARTRRRMIETLRRDPLTKVQGRQALEYALSRNGALKTADYTYVLFNIDDFTTINALYGLTMGDKVLKEIAEHLNRHISANYIYKLNQDEFMVTFPSTILTADSIIRDILNAVETPMTFGNIVLQTSVSAAVYHKPHPTDSLETIVANLKSTMLHVKRVNPGTIAYYDDVIVSTMHKAHRIAETLRALRDDKAHDSFHTVFQPIYDITGSSVSVCGFEALARLEVEGYGTISPDEFIPIAEAQGLIEGVGQAVLKASCTFNRVMVDAGKTAQPISINASSYELLSETFAAETLQTLKDSGVAPKMIQIELTESVFVSHYTQVANSIRTLTENGVKLYIDDFGTGYSSLAYLSSFPIDFIKLDKTFVDRLTVSMKDKTIAEAVLSISHAIGAKVIGEGVETPQQLDILKHLGYHYAQGYLLNKPLNMRDAQALLNDLNTPSSGVIL